MKKREHQQAITQMRQRHIAELERSAAFYEATLAEWQDVCDTYATSLTDQDEQLAALHRQLNRWANLLGDAAAILNEATAAKATHPAHILAARIRAELAQAETI